MKRTSTPKFRWSSILPMLLFSVGLLFSLFGQGQSFHNSWIDYNKTYYKFKTDIIALYRIPFATLDALGLGNVPAEHFQLWRNGQQVPLMPSKTTGSLTAGDFIEFFGERNDGKQDLSLYREAKFQHTDKSSLFTDSVSFFLTVNTAGNNLRLVQQNFSLAGNTIPRENFFMHTAGQYYRNLINSGFAAIVGEYVYSSAYDQGEFWSSGAILPNATGLLHTFSNLFPYTAADAPAPSLKFGATGNALNARNVRALINNSEVMQRPMNFFNDSVFEVKDMPNALVNTGSAAVRILNTSAVSTDRIVVSFIELQYARQFRFGNAANFFEFQMPASNTARYLEITEFNTGGTAPVLLDLTNNEYYTADISVSGQVRVLLNPSATSRRLVLVSRAAAQVRSITAGSFIQRRFQDFTQLSNQGEYLIIQNPRILAGYTGADPIQAFADYRRSADGGGYNVKVYDYNELEDQFAFGINMHPQSVKNFLNYARSRFANAPQFVFMIGRGVSYNFYHARQAAAEGKRINFIPTFGFPGSDNFLSSADSRVGVPLTPIGRLAAVSPDEITDYLEKVKEYETAQRTPSCAINDKTWMKNVLQVTGASDAFLGTVLCNYMQGYQQQLSDSLFGARVKTFCKTTTNIGQESASLEVAKAFEEGLSVVHYFGHSSASTLEFNINDPETYNNQGKYPVFLVNGCNAGNFFAYDLGRLSTSKTLTEKFILSKQRGGIAFVASSNYGIVNYLNIYVDALFDKMVRQDYGLSLGETIRDVMARMLQITGQDDFYGRMHSEQITIHGDPAIKFNTFPKPDYAIEEPQISVEPGFLTIAETKYDIGIKVHNLGQTSGDSLMVKVTRVFPNNLTDTLYLGKWKPVSAADSIRLVVPIVATRDKGTTKIIVQLDPENTIDELCETNNVIEKNIVIFEDEARPVYPYNYSIVQEPVQKFVASTSNPFGTMMTYRIEVDTSRQFNSPVKAFQEIQASGGVLEFNPTVSYRDSAVYYWRTAVKTTDGSEMKWSGSSFVYIPQSEPGWNQSHFGQFTENVLDDLNWKPNRELAFDQRFTSLKVDNAIFPTRNSLIFYIDDNALFASGCGTYFNSIIYFVFNKTTGRPYFNANLGTTGVWGSLNPRCPDNGITRREAFLFYYNTQAGRRGAMNFLDSVPNGSIIAAANFGSTTFNSNPRFINDWMADTTAFGSGRSLYHRYKNIGLNKIDSFYRNIPFILMMEKDENGQFKKILDEVGSEAGSTFLTRYTFSRNGNVGSVKTLRTGAALEWKSMHWKMSHPSPTGDESEVRLYGVQSNGVEQLIYRSHKLTQDTTLDFVDPVLYPRLKLELHQQDQTNHLPRQIEYWQIKYREVPEGALNANQLFNTRDTVEVGEQVNLRIAFKNVSRTAFDSLRLKVQLIDRNNVTHVLNFPRTRPLLTGDTVVISPNIDTRLYPGNNTLFVEVNPDQDQPEEAHFNNFLFRNLFVKPDNKNPLLDVTFDGVHILNRDIVSSRPHIAIKLKDEARFMPLSDTAAVNITLRYLGANGWTRQYRVDGDTVRFTPPANAETDNTAVLDFNPSLLQDGEYELVISGKDLSENRTGSTEYKVIFQTYNKPMISNMLNYPNPFTTSTAFVFTLTGSELPQNMRIQILTVTGKVVREITQAELGPLRIGRNITEYKWDGTDQYGQPLANGIYLYRVITNLNGKSLDKFTQSGDNTDRFFNNGYGKMYLMR